MSSSIAIVGSGPSGFYALDGLARAMPGARIDMIDRLPTPYGLVRSGVAPDHQGTKAVARQFERLAQKPGVRFLGNVEIGRDVSLAELRQIYDAVILATGAAVDRRLGIPGEDLAGIYRSWPVVGWYNGHPDYRHLDFRLRGPAAAVIGNGNVAIDLVRVLAKTAEEMKTSDLCEHAATIIHAAPLTDIYMIGRRGPVEANFTSAELAELAHLARVRPVVEGVDIPDASGIADAGIARIKDKNLEILRGFAGVAGAGKSITLHLLFNATPIAFEGNASLERVVLQASGGGRTWHIPVQTAITAIGYRGAALGDAPVDPHTGVFINDGGEIIPGLYAVGWARRGPSGVIATNRADSLAVADKVAAFVKQQPAKADAQARLDALLADRQVRVCDFAAWLQLNAREIAAGALQGRPRVKAVSWQGLRQAGGETSV
jgi:NADPH-dependent glutamate synthase beta subunit-like oxidoreductase